MENLTTLQTCSTTTCNLQPLQRIKFSEEKNKTKLINQLKADAARIIIDGGLTLTSSP